MVNKNYINPKTGQPCDYDEYTKACAGSSTTSTVATTPTSNIPNWEDYLSSIQVGGEAPDGVTIKQIKEDYRDLFASPPGVTPTTTPTFGEGAAAGISPLEITPAPPYEISPAQQAFEEMYGGTVTDWVEAGGYGIPEETQALMIQKQTDALKARETENIRVMRNNMERRGITNSGFVFANEQAIRSNTSVAIAGAIADVQINSALMKMASFEKAMGAAAQFLGYLSEQSQLKYAPEFATWQAEQMAKMQAWQAKIDIYKMELNQAYQTQNMQLQAQLTSKLNAEQHQYDLQLAEMEIEATQEMAKAEAQGSISGTIVTGLFTLAGYLLL